MTVIRNLELAFSLAPGPGSIIAKLYYRASFFNCLRPAKIGRSGVRVAGLRQANKNNIPIVIGHSTCLPQLRVHRGDCLTSSCHPSCVTKPSKTLKLSSTLQHLNESNNGFPGRLHLRLNPHLLDPLPLAPTPQIPPRTPSIHPPPPISAAQLPRRLFPTALSGLRPRDFPWSISSRSQLHP